MSDNSTPSVRFDGFTNDWEQRKLGDLEKNGLIELGRGKVISATDMKENPGAYPVYSSSAHNNGLMGTYGNYMFDQELITWSIDGGGAVFFRPRHKFSVTNVCGFIICKKQIDTPFLAYQMNNIHSIMGFDYVHKAHPSVIRTLYTLGIPSIDEQKKIGSFFVHIDSTIALCRRKLDLLTQAKKALMQQIFSQKLRFKADDGSDFPEWKKKKLGDICDPLSYGLNAPATAFDGINKYIRITDIDDSTHQYLKDAIVSPGSDLDERYRVGKNDILFARTGASTGKTYLYNPADGVLYFAGFLIRAHVHDEYDSYFVYSQTLTSDYQEWVRSTSMRSGQPGINASEYSEYSFPVPSLPEQHKIAACLSSADALIAQARVELEQWQDVKKSLLQQLFV